MKRDNSPSVCGMSAADDGGAMNGLQASLSSGNIAAPEAATLGNLCSRVREEERTVQALIQALQRASASDGRIGTRAQVHNDGAPPHEQVAVQALHDLACAAARYLAAGDGDGQHQQLADLAPCVAVEAALRESEERYAAADRERHGCDQCLLARPETTLRVAIRAPSAWQGSGERRRPATEGLRP